MLIRRILGVVFTLLMLHYVTWSVSCHNILSNVAIFIEISHLENMISIMFLKLLEFWGIPSSIRLYSTLPPPVLTVLKFFQVIAFAYNLYDSTNFYNCQYFKFYLLLAKVVDPLL